MSNGDKTWKEVRAKTGEDKDGKAYYKTIGRVLETKAGPMLKLDMCSSFHIHCLPTT